MARNVEFDILARDRASKTFDHVAKSSDGLGSKLGTLGKIGATAVAGAAVGGIAALGAAMVTGVKDAARFQTLSLKTAAVLKSTGNVARQSVKGIQARAAALESMSGVDEELIINGQNVLATFTKVRDGVGKGNDIFNQATTAALNMSTALGTDLQGATLQVGKALNNPIKGVTSLSRAGVQFTEQQKKQIKTLVASGKTMEAQKIILGELSTQFGGAAKAAGQGFEGSMARAKDAVGDAFREIGTKLLPVVTRFANYIANNAGPWIDKLSAAMGRLWGWVSGRLWPALQKGYQTVMPALRQALAIVTGGVEGGGMSWKKFGDILTGKVIPFLSKLISVYLPVLATNLRAGIEVVKFMWRAFETWGSVVGRVVAFILRRFADMSSIWAGVLRALGRVPGFGWAKDAAAKMETAGGKARALASAITRIPSRKTVNVHYAMTAGGAPVNRGRINVPGVGYVNAGLRAQGGPIVAGKPYIIGENGPEMVIPRKDGMVIPSQLSQMIRNGIATGGSDDRPILVQVMLDGRMVQQSLLERKRRTGVNLGLA